MRNAYLPYLPIQSEKSAKLLEKEAVWTVFNHIRRSGLDGKTVKEISQELNEPASTIYGAVEALEREGYVRGVKLSKLKKWGRHPKEEAAVQQKGKMAKKYFESCELKAGLAHREEGEKENPWGDVIFSADFYNHIGTIIKNQPELAGLHDSMIKFAAQISKEKVQALSEDSKHLLPSTEKCADCGKSHEGYEFMKAILLYIATEAVDSGNFKNLLKDLGYSV